MGRKQDFDRICDGSIFMSLTAPEAMETVIAERYEFRVWFWRMNGRPLHAPFRKMGAAASKNLSAFCR